MTEVHKANINITFEKDGNIAATMSAHTDDCDFDCSATGQDFDKVIFELSNQLSEKVYDYIDAKNQLYVDINEVVARCGTDKNYRKHLLTQISKWDETKSMFGVSEKPAEKCGTKCDNSWKRLNRSPLSSEDIDRMLKW